MQLESVEQNKFIDELSNYKELKFQKRIKGYKNVYHCLVAQFLGPKSIEKEIYL